VFFYLLVDILADEGGEKMSKVKCMVEECHYNSSYLCDASEIEVRSSGTNSVHQPEQTECRTFRNKG
jgi:hypothetical protein